MDMRKTSYELVGWVGRELVAAGHMIGKVPGKQAVFIDDEFGDQHVAYCARVPALGTRVGLRGTWVQIARRRTEPGARQVQFQLSVRSWEVVPDGYDVLDRTA